MSRATGEQLELRGDRRVRLDAAALVRAGASPVLAIDPECIGGIVVLEAEAPEAEAPDGNGVAIVSIRGPLAQRASDGSMCGYVDGYDAISDRVVSALESPEVGSVVLDIDSPGGDLAGLEEAVDRMVAERQASDKPVYAYANEQAASAAYWIGAAVAGKGRVFLPKAGAVGSIGVIGGWIDETEALAQEGVAVTLIREPAGKAAGHPMGPVADVADERMTKRVKASAGRFFEAMASARGMTTSAVHGLDGAMASGADAVRLGLADGVMSFDAVVKRAAAEGGKRQAVREKLEALRVRHGLADNATEDDILDANGAILDAVDLEATTTADAAMAARPAAALGDAVLKLAATDDPAIALGKAEAWKTSHERATEERADVEAQQETLDATERDKLVSKLVALGWEKPPTAWEDPRVADKPELRKPAEPWASMPLASLRARVETLEAQPRALGGPSDHVVSAAASGLSEFELKLCEKRGISPADFAAKKAKVHEQRTGSGTPS